MINRIMILFLFTFVFITLVNCIDKRNRLHIENDIGLEDFREFAHKFRTDKAFRKSRVLHPLPGFNSDDIDYSDNGVGVSNNYFWNKTAVLVYLDESYKVDSLVTEIIYSSDTLVKERSYIVGSGFEVSRKFTIIDRKWYLTYLFYRN